MLRNEEQPVDEEEDEDDDEEEERYTTVSSRGREEVGGYSVITSMRRGRGLVVGHRCSKTLARGLFLKTNP